MVKRGRGICTLAVSASLLGVPLVGLPGPGHRDVQTAARGSSLVASPDASRPAATAQPSFRQGPGDGGYGHGQGNGYSYAPSNGPGDSGQGNSGQGQHTPPGHDQSQPPSPPAGPPAPTHQQVPPTPQPPTTTTTQTPTAPSTTSSQGTDPTTDTSIPTQGPGDAHGLGHADSNSGGPPASLQGQGNSGSTPCDGLCHDGQSPSLTPATAVTIPSVTVNATPTPPVTVVPSTTPLPTTTPSSNPTTITLPTLPGFPSTVALGTSGARTGVGLGAGAALTALAGSPTTLGSALTGSGVFGLPGTLTATAGGTGTLTPNPALGLVPAAATTGAAAHHHAAASSHGGGTTVLLIPRFITRIPESVWIALGASLLLAALGAGVAVATRRRAAAQAGQLAAVSAAALTDPLTGVLNRRGFIEAVERELARARRYQHPFVLAYVDVRGLKNVNDTEGHLTGDTLLKNVAELLTDSARADDVVGRLGGDELGLLLVEQTPDAARAVTRRIEAQVATRRKAMNLGSHWDLTIGTAAFPQDGQSIDELLGTADRRLYQQRGIQLLGSR